MKMKVKEFASLTGVSVRTLHYYDEIGLLKPESVDEQTGYRFYDEKSLERMQEILFYRELDFSLKNILQIITSPNYDKKKALREQKELLILKKKRLERLILALENAENGGNAMSMKVFDNSEFEKAREKYAKEAKQRWGDTSAYKENVEKTRSYSKEKWNQVDDGMNNLLAEFAECVAKGTKPSDEVAQKLVEKWQDYITENHYNCTNEILAGLGQMYTCDERFQKNIDKHGAGTAAFMSEAIKVYCQK